MFIIRFFQNLAEADPIKLWIYGLVAASIIAGIATGFFKARKVQPKGFKWKIFGWEALVAVVGGFITGKIFFAINSVISTYQLNQINPSPASWWQIALEYGAYFILFDTWFYWLHRWMHTEPWYSLIHKIHHKSTSPNVLTTLSVNPLESVINGGFVWIFLGLCTLIALPVHKEAAALILPTNIIMGVYVHSGYEFFPRWWNKSWATKWFITATFHDQHHKYFNWNFGGYTTVWDRICGTMRKNFESDFDKIKARNKAEIVTVSAPNAQSTS